MTNHKRTPSAELRYHELSCRTVLPTVAKLSGKTACFGVLAYLVARGGAGATGGFPSVWRRSELKLLLELGESRVLANAIQAGIHIKISEPFGMVVGGLLQPFEGSVFVPQAEMNHGNIKSRNILMLL